MGWTYFKTPPGKTTREILEREFSSITFKETAVVGSTFYAAAVHPSEPEKVFGLVVLLERSGASFGYKEMDESEGPYESQCPAEILDLLSPTDYEYAIAWRARCRANAAQKAFVGYVKAEQFELIREEFKLV